MGISAVLEYHVDINSPAKPIPLPFPLAEGDVIAQTILIHVTDNGEPADLSGLGVTGKFLASDGSYFSWGGTADAVNGLITLPIDAQCYRPKNGYFDLIVRGSQTDNGTEVRRTFLWLQGTTRRTVGTTEIASGSPLPSVDDVLAKISQMETARAQAQSVIGTAQEAVNRLDQAIARVTAISADVSETTLVITTTTA